MSDGGTLKVGDLLEVELPNGSRRYVQYIGDSEDAELVRVIRGAFASPPADVSAVAGGETDFICMLALRRLVDDGVVGTVAHAQRPADHVTHPLMRMAHPPRQDGVRLWSLYDGLRTFPREHQTDEEMSRLPIRQVVGWPLFVHQLEHGWRPTMEPVVTPPEEGAGEVGEVTVFFVAAPENDDRLVSELRAYGCTEIEAVPSDRMVTAKLHSGTSDFSLFQIDEQMEDLARRCGVEYDGNEVRVE